MLSKNSYKTFRLNLRVLFFIDLSVDERGLKAFERTSLLEVLFLEKILYLEEY